jgi:hypothetical protein
LVTWADRVLGLSPRGGAKRGSMLAKLRHALALQRHFHRNVWDARRCFLYRLYAL